MRPLYGSFPHRLSSVLGEGVLVAVSRAGQAGGHLIIPHFQKSICSEHGTSPRLLFIETSTQRNPPATFAPGLFSKVYFPRDAWAGNERRRFLWPQNMRTLRIRTESEHKNIYVPQTEGHVLNMKQTQNTQPRGEGQGAAEDRTGGELWVPGTWQVEAAGNSGSWMGNSYSYQSLPHKCLPRQHQGTMVIGNAQSLQGQESP